MTATIVAELTGEERLRQRRRAFVRLTLMGGVIGAIIGMSVLVTGGFAEGWQRAHGDAIGWIMWPVLALAGALFVYYCRRYFAQIDELDLEDNLWASLIGLYCVIMCFPAWEVLHRLDQLPPATAMGLWVIGIVTTCIAYGWRKLANRF